MIACITCRTCTCAHQIPPARPAGCRYLHSLRSNVGVVDHRHHDLLLRIAFQSFCLWLQKGVSQLRRACLVTPAHDVLMHSPVGCHLGVPAVGASVNLRASALLPPEWTKGYEKTVNGRVCHEMFELCSATRRPQRVGLRLWDTLAILANRTEARQVWHAGAEQKELLLLLLR